MCYFKLSGVDRIQLMNESSANFVVELLKERLKDLVLLKAHCYIDACEILEPFYRISSGKYETKLYLHFVLVKIRRKKYDDMVQLSITEKC